MVGGSDAAGNVSKVEASALRQDRPQGLVVFLAVIEDRSWTMQDARHIGHHGRLVRREDLRAAQGRFVADVQAYDVRRARTGRDIAAWRDRHPGEGAIFRIDPDDGCARPMGDGETFH